MFSLIVDFFNSLIVCQVEFVLSLYLGYNMGINKKIDSFDDLIVVNIATLGLHCVALGCDN